MKKLKILRIIARLNIGGPAIHTIILTSGLDKARFDTLLVSGMPADSEGDMHTYAREKGVEISFIPELNRRVNVRNDFIAFVKLLVIMNREKPDIIHTHTAKAGTLGRCAGLCYKMMHPFRALKMLHTFHGHVFGGYFNTFATVVFLSIERFLSFWTDRIIAVSESVKEDLLSLGIFKMKRDVVIPLGLELNTLSRIPLKEHNTQTIGIVGRLVPIKNHRLFLDAVSIVIKEPAFKKARFKIIGDGELREGLIEYIRKQCLDAYVEFLGWKHDREEIYKDLDVVVLTSKNEGTPLSLIEALASRRSVVAADVGGVKDLIGKIKTHHDSALGSFYICERGIRVPSQRAGDFAAGIIHMLSDDSLRQEMAEKGRTFALDHFSHTRLIHDVESLYTGLYTPQKTR